MRNKTEGRYRQLVSNTFLFALGNFGSKFLVFLLLPLYTNALTTGEYGISEILLTATNLVIPFVSVSIQDATLRFALDKRNSEGEVIKNTVVVLTIGALITCVLTPIVRFYQPLADWSIFFSAITIAYMFRNAFSIYIKAIGKSKLFAIDSILYTAFLMVFNILFLVVFPMGLSGYFLATLISTIISTVFLSAFGHILRSCKNSKVNRSLMRDMIRFSIPMIFNNVSWWIINSSDKMMIEYFMSAGDSGIYSVAAKMPSLISAVTTVFNQAWLISSVTEYDTSRDSSFFTNTFNAFNALIILFAAFIILIIKPFMQIYVGPGFVESWQYVPLLLLGSIFQAYATFFGAIYTSAKRNVSVMMTTFLAAAVNIGLNVVLIQQIGIQGAVIATAVAYFVVFVFRMIDSQKYIRFKIDFKVVGFSVLILTLQCICTIFEWHSFFVSCLSILALVLINYSTLRILVTKGLGFLGSIKGKKRGL